MSDNRLNLLKECTARCVHFTIPSVRRVHIFPWGDSKMYKSGNIANSHKMPTEINKTGAIGRVRTFVEQVIMQDIYRHLEYVLMKCQVFPSTCVDKIYIFQFMKQLFTWNVLIRFVYPNSWNIVSYVKITFPIYSLLDFKMIQVYYRFLFNPYKLMSG